MRIDPFTVSIPDPVLTDLRERIGRTRWPDAAPGEAWSQGVEVDYLRELLAYWADGFDWRAAEGSLAGDIAEFFRLLRQPAPE